LKRDFASDFAYIRYLSLITGEGTRLPQSRHGWRGDLSTGPRDWQLTWDMELSVWEFRKRPKAVRTGMAPPPALGNPAASPEVPGP
jgi:hypothetical protein